jgi:tetratricopeptide (TPR) repeat protein
MHSTGYLFWGELCVHTGQREKAMQNLNRAKLAFKEMEMDWWLAITYAAYADLSKRQGDLSKAKENLHNAIEIFKELGAGGWVAKYEKELTVLS